MIMQAVSALNSVDFLGPTGGMMGLAFAGGCVFTGSFLWRFVIKEMKADAKEAKAELLQKYKDDLAYLQEIEARKNAV